MARLLAGLSVLTGGGWLLGDGLSNVVRHLAISQTLLGNTALAATVEAEELARVAVPARRGRSELALGNIAGTIIHFEAFNAGVIALVKPLALDHNTTRFYLPAAAASPAILAAAALLLARRWLGRIEGAGSRANPLRRLPSGGNHHLYVTPNRVRPAIRHASPISPRTARGRRVGADVARGLRFATSSARRVESRASLTIRSSGVLCVELARQNARDGRCEPTSP